MTYQKVVITWIQLICISHIYTSIDTYAYANV